MTKILIRAKKKVKICPLENILGDSIMGFICRYFTAKTIEEIVSANCVGMTDAQKAQYWYELTQNIFAILGKIDVPRFELDAGAWIFAAQQQYPTLTEVKFADSRFFTTTEESVQLILTRDWTNLVPYVAEIGDCDKFATSIWGKFIRGGKISQ